MHVSRHFEKKAFNAGSRLIQSERRGWPPWPEERASFLWATLYANSLFDHKKIDLLLLYITQCSVVSDLLKQINHISLILHKRGDAVRSLQSTCLPSAHRNLLLILFVESGFTSNALPDTLRIPVLLDVVCTETFLVSCLFEMLSNLQSMELSDAKKISVKNLFPLEYYAIQLIPQWIIYSSMRLVISLSYAINEEFPMLKVLLSSSPFSLWWGHENFIANFKS